MRNIEGDHALVAFIEQARTDELFGSSDIEVQHALFNAKERIARAEGQAALFGMVFTEAGVRVSEEVL